MSELLCKPILYLPEAASAMSLLGRTGRAALTFVLLNGLQRGVPLIILPFISHVMAPAEYGAASILTASSLFLTTVLAAPLEALVFRAAARSDDDAPAILRVAGIYCYFLIPVALAALAVGVALMVPKFLDISGRIWAIEMLAMGFQPAMTYFALPVVQSRQNLRTFGWLASTSILLTVSAKIVFVLVWQLGVLGWVLADLIGAVLTAALAIVLVRPPKATVTVRHVRSVVGFAVPLIPHRTAFWAITSLSRPLMAIVSSLAQVGWLSLGLNIASVAQLLLVEINRAVLPRYSRETLPAPTQQTLPVVGIQVVIALVLPAMVGAALALLGQHVFAEPYWPAFGLTGILLIGQAALGIYVIPTNYVVQAAGTTRLIGLASGTGGVAIFVSLLIFGGRYGAVGAAWSTVGGFITMTTVAAILPRILNLDIAWHKWLKCWPEAALGAVALGCGVAALNLPVGSNAAHALAGLALAPSVGALVVSVRRWQLR